jgi:hypothetical protein
VVLIVKAPPQPSPKGRENRRSKTINIVGFYEKALSFGEGWVGLIPLRLPSF